MNQGEFYSAYEATLMEIEEAIDGLDADIDYENVNGILTITCPDASQVIITPQSSTSQLWVAARSGGFHFSRSEEGTWLRTTDGLRLGQVLDSVFSEQAGCALDLP